VQHDVERLPNRERRLLQRQAVNCVISGYNQDEWMVLRKTMASFDLTTFRNNGQSNNNPIRWHCLERQKCRRSRRNHTLHGGRFGGYAWRKIYIKGL